MVRPDRSGALAGLVSFWVLLRLGDEWSSVAALALAPALFHALSMRYPCRQQASWRLLLFPSSPFLVRFFGAILSSCHPFLSCPPSLAGLVNLSLPRQSPCHPCSLAYMAQLLTMPDVAWRNPNPFSNPGWPPRPDEPCAIGRPACFSGFLTLLALF